MGSESLGDDRVVMTTHKVVIDANDEAHAKYLVEALANDGYRVSRERHEFVVDDKSLMTVRRIAE